MLSAERNGVKLFFEEARGAGAPVVLVHGWCCDHTYFAPQFEYFAKKGRRVVALDLRGHGLSDKPRERYTMQGFADDVAFICDHLGLGKVVVIGHSMGGIVAFDLASRYPELVSALIMLDAAIVLASSRSRRCARPGRRSEPSGLSAGHKRLHYEDFASSHRQPGTEGMDTLVNGVRAAACCGLGLSGPRRI